MFGVVTKYTQFNWCIYLEKLLILYSQLETITIIYSSTTFNWGTQAVGEGSQGGLY